MNEVGEAIGLHDEDYIHNGKKLLNPLDSNVRTLRLEADMALHQQVCQVFNCFSVDQHGLLQRILLEKTSRMGLVLKDYVCRKCLIACGHSGCPLNCIVSAL